MSAKRARRARDIGNTGGETPVFSGTMLQHPLCCLCGGRIRGRPLDIPQNDAGERVLPPRCAQRAANISAPGTGTLHHEKGHWCYNMVAAERKLQRDTSQTCQLGAATPWSLRSGRL